MSLRIYGWLQDRFRAFDSFFFLIQQCTSPLSWHHPKREFVDFRTYLDWFRNFRSKKSTTKNEEPRIFYLLFVVQVVRVKDEKNGICGKVWLLRGGCQRLVLVAACGGYRFWWGGGKFFYFFFHLLFNYFYFFIWYYIKLSFYPYWNC